MRARNASKEERSYQMRARNMSKSKEYEQGGKEIAMSVSEEERIEQGV